MYESREEFVGCVEKRDRSVHCWVRARSFPFADSHHCGVVPLLWRLRCLEDCGEEVRHLLYLWVGEQFKVFPLV